MEDVLMDERQAVTRQIFFLVVGLLFLASGVARANTFLVSDTIHYFEKTFGEECRLREWTTADNGSGLDYKCGQDFSINFSLQQNPSLTYLQRINVFCLNQKLTSAEAEKFISFIRTQEEKVENWQCKSLKERHTENIVTEKFYDCTMTASGSKLVMKLYTQHQDIKGQNSVSIRFDASKATP
jgi:hypothetical protein